ncbi:hypothetical protein [Eremococcus coleocola]|uniref:Uncharacterized protein n=1 Tax=Eremococcus coleocola ACS-139-V-Col8 TaxID=908337 RepID=E4KLZ6_9LACT|nr:hypothetical protein [Eremococcus coleocola]EFR32025.1 hypothetical protein HMPREF9257_0979 [Eremococcus coleocola ACS-139-V-Col8]
MNLWILIIVLLVISIILFAISLFSGNDADALEDKVDDYTEQFSKELFAIKSRLTELEKQEVVRDDSPAFYQSEDVTYLSDTPENGVPTDVPVNDLAEADQTVDAIDISTLSEDEMDSIIKLYSQGYTMQEISDAVNIGIPIVQAVVDDYIENR